MLLILGVGFIVYVRSPGQGHLGGIMVNWDDTFMELACVIAKRSKDNSSKIGAVIVGPHREIVSMGYNGMPRLINDDVAERHVRPTKYLWFEHAERNAIYNAARLGHKVAGCGIYISGLPPCADCARAIIQSGILSVKVASWEIPARWEENMNVAKAMLQEAGVILL